MTNGIVIKLAQPDRVIVSTSVAAVIIPAKESNLTIVPGRAPSMVMLTNGIVQLLDNRFETIGKYYIKGGYVDIANDTCVLSSEVIIDKKSITLETARAKLEELLPPEVEETEKTEEVEEPEQTVAPVADEQPEEDEQKVEIKEKPNKQEKRLDPLSSKEIDTMFYQMIVDDLIAFK